MDNIISFEEALLFKQLKEFQQKEEAEILEQTKEEIKLYEETLGEIIVKETYKRHKKLLAA